MRAGSLFPRFTSKQCVQTRRNQRLPFPPSQKLAISTPESHYLSRKAETDTGQMLGFSYGHSESLAAPSRAAGGVTHRQESGQTKAMPRQSEPPKCQRREKRSMNDPRVAYSRHPKVEGSHGWSHSRWTGSEGNGDV